MYYLMFMVKNKENKNQQEPLTNQGSDGSCVPEYESSTQLRRTYTGPQADTTQKMVVFTAIILRTLNRN
jgi:hypothetical protein